MEGEKPRRGREYLKLLPLWSSVERHCYACGWKHPAREMRLVQRSSVPVGERHRWRYICEGCDESSDRLARASAHQ